jgi:hypothetical protein
MDPARIAPRAEAAKKAKTSQPSMRSPAGAGTLTRRSRGVKSQLQKDQRTGWGSARGRIEGCIPTPRPAPDARRSASATLGLTSAPFEPTSHCINAELCCAKLSVVSMPLW